MNAHASNGHFIDLQKVSKRFGDNGNGTTAISNVSLSCSAGELVLLLGPSGSGKTTLLTLMAGLIEPSEGQVLLFGEEVRSYSDGELQRIRAHRLGFIFQNFLLIESLSVLENIVLVLRFAGITGSHAIEEARRLLRQFSIEHLSDKSPLKLSQGEKQRVAIARAIANGGELIIADEPTASLESSQGLQVIELLRNLAHAGNRCVVVASHDRRLVEFADCVVRLRDGAIEALEVHR
ncbi:MAG TPA: ABC transporter ATP-binding protein [Bacteroidetes bacterium]|nr:ABC transporter ATP-binding protein [Bacteroidota bacterium]